MLELKKLNLKRGGFSLKLENIKFSNASINLLLGPNGSGKSSLFKSLLGLFPCEMDIHVDSKVFKPKDSKSRARFFSYLPQASSYAEFLVRDVLIQGRFPYTGFLSRYDKKDWDKIYEISSHFGLNDYLLRDISSLSQGELQRVMLAKVFAQEARILLLDEPTTSLDIGFKRMVVSYIEKYMELRPDSILIISSHEPELFIERAKTALMLKEGRKFSIGPAKEVYTEDNINKIFPSDAFGSA